MNKAKTLSAVLALYAGDEAVKKYMVHHLEKGKEKPVLGGKAVLHRLENPGAAMGLGENHQKALNLLTGGMLGALGLQLLFSGKEQGNLKRAAMVLMAAGGLGNLTDRVCQGHVDDYIRIPCRNEKLSRVVFNLADVFVAAGVGLSVIAELKPCRAEHAHPQGMD